MKVKTAITAVGLAVGTAVVPVAFLAAPAHAATPGAACTVGTNVIRIPGTVDSDGRTCFPNPGHADILSKNALFSSLNAGLQCGNRRAIGSLAVTAKCPK